MAFHTVKRLSVLFTSGTQVGASKACLLNPACMCVCVYFFVEAMLFDMFQLCVDLWVCVYVCVCVGVGVCMWVCVCVAEKCFRVACSVKSLDLLTALLLPVKHENNSLCEQRVTVGATP